MTRILSFTLGVGLAALLAACSTQQRTAPGTPAGSAASAPGAKVPQAGPARSAAPQEEWPQQRGNN